MDSRSPIRSSAVVAILLGLAAAAHAQSAAGAGRSDRLVWTPPSSPGVHRLPAGTTLGAGGGQRLVVPSDVQVEVGADGGVAGVSGGARALTPSEAEALGVSGPAVSVPAVCVDRSARAPEVGERLTVRSDAAAAAVVRAVQEVCDEQAAVIEVLEQRHDLPGLRAHVRQWAVWVAAREEGEPRITVEEIEAALIEAVAMMRGAEGVDLEAAERAAIAAAAPEIFAAAASIGEAAKTRVRG